MEPTNKIPDKEIERQYEYMWKLRERNLELAAKRGVSPRAMVRTYGCQMNEHDSERLSGMLTEMGYELVPGDDAAKWKPDIVIFNTCCVRENAEEKVFGHIGALKAIKRENPDMLIGVCGCMTEQPHVVEEIRQKYKTVDLVFGTQNLYTFPELLYKCIDEHEHVYDISHLEGRVPENVPVVRADKYRAWVTVMYGCNNFCSYCVVPYVRGRERSRSADDILDEVKALRQQGFMEITLLGQNVNSYGLDRENELSFAGLLDRICRETDIPRIRFMTSHPKDLSPELIEVMASQPQICKQLHLPVQSGSTPLLKKMNRKYTAEQYLKLVEDVRRAIPDIALTTDVIVGFPGETEEDFQATLDLFETVRYDKAFTFIYSPRVGTPAARMEQVPQDIIKDRFDRLLTLQNGIDLEINKTYEGRRVEILAEGLSKTNDKRYTGRTESNKVVNFNSDTDVSGKMVTVEITQAATWSLDGILV